MRLRWLFVTITLLFLTTASGLLAQSIINPDQAWGTASGGVRMAISAVKAGQMPQRGAKFYVAFQNVGDRDVLLNLGSMLANGKLHWPHAVRLILIGPQGQTKELNFTDKRHPGIGGRVDDFIVALRAGATYILLLNLEEYCSPLTKEFDVKLDDGRYRIGARFRGEGAKSVNIDMQGIALMNFWKGAIQSNFLDFEVSGLAALK